MADSTKVKIGVCNVGFNGTDLGYTSGAVTVAYNTETYEKEVDQEDVPVGELITKQTFEVKVPLAEYDLEKFADLLPGATLTIDSTDSTKMKLELSGSAGTDLQTMAQELVLTPTTGDVNDVVTLHHAIPVPNLEFSYEKENTRVYEMTFKALKGTSGFVTLGDTTAAA